VRHSIAGEAGLRSVALIYDAARSYDLQVMTGVAAYLTVGSGWSLEAVRRLVSDTQLSPKQIAAKAGFTSVQRMTTRRVRALPARPPGFGYFLTGYPTVCV
jgi:methylphosphotriester-DNA--protein-cysteine methyltransferase